MTQTHALAFRRSGKSVSARPWCVQDGGGGVGVEDTPVLTDRAASTRTLTS